MLVEKFQINGTAVRSGLSRNGIKYIDEELANFAPTLISRPMLKDHIPKTDNTIGLVEASGFSAGAVSYNGWIKDKPTEEKITDGRIKEVSIGAIAEKLVVEDEDDPESPLIAVGLVAMELSTTPTPAVVGTSIKQCLHELKEAKTANDKLKVKPIIESIGEFKEIEEDSKANETLEVNKMADDEKKDEKTSDEETKTEEKTHELKIDVDTSKIDEATEKIEKLLELKQKLKEADGEVEEKPDPVEDQKEEEKEEKEEDKKEETKEDPNEILTKGKVSDNTKTDEEAKLDGYVMEECKNGKGYSFFKV